MKRCSFLLLCILLITQVAPAQSPSPAQLESWLKRFPEADTNRDGKLTVEEALAYRDKLQRGKAKGRNPGAPREFKVDPGWEQERFPEHAVSHLSPEKIAAVYAGRIGDKWEPVTSFDKPESGALRIVGTGHSFMAPGYRTFPQICKAAGFEQPLFTHTGGGITGSARYKWEQENGIFEFDGRPLPRLLASIANAEWEAMMWGPYFNDRPEYYSCWINFCLKYHPAMKFYLSDAWPQLFQLGENPESEDFFTDEVLDRIGKEKRELYTALANTLRESYPDKVFILPTSDAMVLAAKRQIRGELPGVEGIHTVIGGKERSLWRDQLGHLGPGFDRLEGYVFYATMYGKSPALIEEKVNFTPESDFPGPELDRVFREIAWEAVTGHPFSGVVDADGDGSKDQ
ncbi:MAG: hypothetical protein P1U81_15165 [Verrucomicrobiales bacterium]|nr:hypothetical protein [Verrucomicrobiales bacterium]